MARMTRLGSCLVLLLLADLSSARIVKLHPKETLRDRLLRLGRFEDYHKERQEVSRLGLAAGLGVGTEEEANEPLFNRGDASYYGTVDAGNPLQPYKLIMDTGSSNTWITSSRCKQSVCPASYGTGYLCRFLSGGQCTCPMYTPFVASASADPCAAKSRFDCSASSTCRASNIEFSIQYGTGACAGNLVTDRVCVGEKRPEQLCVPHHTFGEATHLADFFAGQAFDGIMGLGFRSIAADNVEPFVDQLIGQGAMDPLFTVWMTKKTGEDGGQITFGALDSEHCNTEDINYAALTAETYWQFRVNSVSVDSDLVKSYEDDPDDGQVISDTGTSFISGPTDVIAAIAAKLGATGSGGLYAMPCDGDSPDVVFTIPIVGKGPIQFHIKRHNYVIPFRDGCYLAMEGQKTTKALRFIMGDTWIRQFCQVYDKAKSRIGFMDNKAQ